MNPALLSIDRGQTNNMKIRKPLEKSPLHNLLYIKENAERVDNYELMKGKNVPLPHIEVVKSERPKIFMKPKYIMKPMNQRQMRSEALREELSPSLLGKQI